MNNPSQLPISGDTLLHVWQNLATALATNDITTLENAVHSISTISPTDKKIIEELIAMMPQPWLPPMIISQIFSDPEAAVGALSRLGASNASAAAAFFGSVESAIVLSCVVNWMQSQNKQAELLKELSTKVKEPTAQSTPNNPMNIALKAYIENKGAATSVPTTQSLQYLKDNPILLSTLKTADPDLLTKAFQIAEAQIVLSCLNQMIESQARIREEQVKADEKRQALKPTPGQIMLQGYLQDIKTGKLDLSQSVMMVMQFLLVVGGASSVPAIAQTSQPAVAPPTQTGSIAPSSQVSSTPAPIQTGQPAQTGELGGSTQTTATSQVNTANLAQTGQVGATVSTQAGQVGATVSTQVGQVGATVSSQIAQAPKIDNIAEIAQAPVITQPSQIGQVGQTAQAAMVTDTGQVVSITQSTSIADVVALAGAGAALGFLPINDVTKSWDSAFQSVMPDSATNQIARSKELQEQLGLLASVYSQMAPYWSIPAAVSFITIAGEVKEKTISEASVRAYASAIGALVNHPDFSLLIKNLILRNVKDPQTITEELLKAYTSALKVTLLTNAFVAIQLTIFRKVGGHFSAQEMHDMIMGRIPLPADDDLSAGLIRLIQEELKNIPNGENFLAHLLSTYSDSSSIEALIDPSKQFLRLCDPSFSQNQSAAETI